MAALRVQLIPEISSLSAVTTAVPLFSVLTLTAIKYGYDDIVSIKLHTIYIMAVIKRCLYTKFIAEIIQEICGHFHELLKGKLGNFMWSVDSMN